MPKAGEKFSGLLNSHTKRTDSTHKNMHTYEREFTESEGRKDITDVLEVWFAGCHCGKLHSLMLGIVLVIIHAHHCRRRWWVSIKRSKTQPC